jgi:methylthioribulose-1-phosphate dehydratase
VHPDPHLNNNAAAAMVLKGDIGWASAESRGPEPNNETPEAGSSEWDEGRLRVELCGAMVAIHQRGWCDGTGGNFSCVLERHPLALLMAPSGVDKGRVQPEQLLVVDGEGGVCRGGGRASAETLLHLAIVKETGAGAVLHTHSQAGTLLSQMSWELAIRSTNPAPLRGSRSSGHEALDFEESCEGDGVAFLELRNLEMLKGIAGITTHRSEVRIPVLANDQDLERLSQRARPHMSEAPSGILIAGHGLYAWGRELSEARRHLEILEFLLEQRWRQLVLEALMRSGQGSA